MDALIRFTPKGGFKKIEDVKKYFEEKVPKQDNYFYSATKINQITKDDEQREELNQIEYNLDIQKNILIKSLKNDFYWK